MNKRDIIIVAVLLNTGLLSMLAMMAIHTGESFEEKSDNSILAYENPKAMVAHEASFIAQNSTVAADEWDSVLKDYVLSSSSQSALSEDDEFEKEAEAPKKKVKEVALQKTVVVEKPVVKAPIAQTSIKSQATLKPQEKPIVKNPNIGKTIEVTVKKGDALEKIARSNGTTAEQIKALNNLKSDRLSIGQQLLIPLDGEKIAKQIPQVVQTPSVDEMEYYVLKSGDNPWKIAKQFKVKFEDLLKLNNLDEEKARNLKIGDRIRVK